MLNNNDILRRLRYVFDFNDDKMISIFASVDSIHSRAVISNWMKKFSDDDFVEMPDADLALFLDGLIIEKRGKKEGSVFPKNQELNNNIILRKLKIALNLIDQDIIDVLKLANYQVSKHEVSAFFRKPTQSQYRECQNQILRNFLKGLQLKFRA